MSVNLRPMPNEAAAEVLDLYQPEQQVWVCNESMLVF